MKKKMNNGMLSRMTVLLIALCTWSQAGCVYTISGNPDVSLLTVAVSPLAATISPGTTLQLTARVSGARSDSSVSWNIVGAQTGQLSSNGPVAIYQAPFLINAPTTVIVRAVANEDPTNYAECRIVVENPVPTSGNVSVLLNPTSVTLAPSTAQQFQANVFGAADTSVTWSVSIGMGTITQNGVYTAPPIFSGAGFAMIQATSHADSTATATAVVNFGMGADSTICFTGAVLPIFANNCISAGCHGPDRAAAGLDLTTYAGARKSANPGDARGSRLYKAIVDFNANTRMPPPPQQALTPQEVRTIGEWIDQGAQNTSCQ